METLCEVKYEYHARLIVTLTIATNSGVLYGNEHIALFYEGSKILRANNKQ